MRVIEARNVHEALPFGLKHLEQYGVKRDSRNGPVLVTLYPVTTVYLKPQERVLFWSQRDANPFFHLYESLWMLLGRNDVAPLVRYAKNSGNYSDDGITQWGAYGHRWRQRFDRDQLPIIIQQLKENPEDRRNVLQMWDSRLDLGRMGKDLPCNTTATLQRGIDGALNIVVFCRSNDMIWGGYGANAVQFSMLLEYLALGIRCPIGTYSQVSVNFHAYLDTFEKVKGIRPDPLNWVHDPYSCNQVHPIPMEGSIDEIDESIRLLLENADSGEFKYRVPNKPWELMVNAILWTHAIYKGTQGENKFKYSLSVLDVYPDQKADWIVAARDWIERRYTKWQTSNADNI